MICNRGFCVIFILFALLYSGRVCAQSPIGIWKTIDDKTGKPKSHVEWYKEGEVLKARVVKLLADPEDTLCDKCKGELKNKPVKGMVISNGLKWNGEKYTDGSILDPESGKEYQCHMWMEGNNRLVVRGFIGFSMIGRSQVWERIK